MLSCTEPYLHCLIWTELVENVSCCSWCRHHHWTEYRLHPHYSASVQFSLRIGAILGLVGITPSSGIGLASGTLSSEGNGTWWLCALHGVDGSWWLCALLTDGVASSMLAVILGDAGTLWALRFVSGPTSSRISPEVLHKCHHWPGQTLHPGLMYYIYPIIIVVHSY